MLFYLCDTEGGSSGSPLVKTAANDHRHVIALHRGWLKLRGNSFNYGTMMSTIVDDIEGKHSNYCKYYAAAPFNVIYGLYFVVNDENDIVKAIEAAGISM